MALNVIDIIYQSAYKKCCFPLYLPTSSINQTLVFANLVGPIWHFSGTIQDYKWDWTNIILYLSLFGYFSLCDFFPYFPLGYFLTTESFCRLCFANIAFYFPTCENFAYDVFCDTKIEVWQIYIPLCLFCANLKQSSLLWWYNGNFF